jgi:hypothetical protein
VNLQTYSSGVNDLAAAGSENLLMNGTTDYMELWLEQFDTVNRNSTSGDQCRLNGFRTAPK